MSAQLKHLDDVVSQSLAHERKSGDDLRSFIKTMNAALNVNAAPEALEQLARDIEERFGITMGLGATVDDESFRPWLDEAKASIDPYYWDRYKKLLHKNGLPQDVITGLDQITDRILGRLGNPGLAEKWDRRGMVVGHVQSGKTANYSGLICKAADAGYRLVVVIAGIHNNLRNQTQERIDEGFIGRDTGRLATQGKKGNRAIGVGLFDDRKVPVSLTNTLFDFKKDTASTNTSQIDSYKVPVVLVIKKNHNTLRNLLDWLRENSARGDDQMIDQPMLLIDDEADNASINTKYSKEEITKINGQIRDLLNMFHRSCYVGYTATPFANIFVDPDQYDDVLKEDLFPKHFIVGLDAPSNYFGAKKIFIDGIPDEGDPVWLRTIRDNEDILPIKHKIDQTVDELHESLKEAVRAFLIARTIRNLRGQAASHCSMLVNASRFTDVQGRLRNRLHEYLGAVLDSLRINGSRGMDGLRDPQIAALQKTWQREYAEAEPDWSRIQGAMLDAVASAKVVEVNSRSNGLDYSGESSVGQTVIAVGGFSLSRGLTLEGLTVTWFLRNTMMYDTLMQMGRWFGYRGGYEDLCRIWMPSEAIDWYAHIAEASEELHLELKKMEKAKASPADFGLAVRSHPASLLVTARNKMGSGQKHVLIGLSNAWVETAKISAKPADISANEDAARKLLEDLASASFRQSSAEKVTGGFLLRGVSVNLIDDFLLGWRNHEQAFLTQTAPIRSYIGERKHDELLEWDVLVTSVSGDAEPFELAGWIVGPQLRKVGYKDLADHLFSMSERRARIASRGVEKIGVDPVKAKQAEEEYLQSLKEDGKPESRQPSFPDRIYRQVRDKPLFVLHVVKVRPPEESGLPHLDRIPDRPVIGWSISFPQSAKPSDRVEYIINTQKFREIYGSDEEDDGAFEDD
ncbi:Z1 domain-containing protein [Ruegeria sp. B32]|uniref:Z1 domain-containing protein n=1 Tax=Ruegeria sp. B32 TaxID=2867020 RepID=UPI0021A46D0D|nr:Z1 domain-containing protein [Ruegeria sp. B32]UWR06534.1 Z1 domain-containing protein [Ruegeria sp. B32]